MVCALSDRTHVFHFCGIKHNFYPFLKQIIFFPNWKKTLQLNQNLSFSEKKADNPHEPSHQPTQPFCSFRRPQKNFVSSVNKFTMHQKICQLLGTLSLYFFRVSGRKNRDLTEFPAQTRPNLPQHLTISLLFFCMRRQEKSDSCLCQRREPLRIIAFCLQAAARRIPAPAHP